MQVRLRTRRFASIALLPIAAAALAACTSTLEGPGIDYRSEGKAPKRESLEVPPDLSQLPRDDRYVLPDSGRSSATASQVQKTQQAQQPTPTSAVVAPSANNNARIERDGNQRWIVVNQSPEAVWNTVREFWRSNGFTLRVENRESGVLETDWAENRASAPRDLVRRTLGTFAGGTLFDTGERDLYRTRIERSGTGTEIYISHRGIVEVLNQQKDATVWQPRPSDPGLEAEFLQRLLVQLGTPEATAKNAVAGANLNSADSAANGGSDRAKLVDGNPPAIALDEPLDRAWRRVGLSLDRTGFTVEDRDRANGIYGVRFVEPEKPEPEGFMSRIFGRKKDPKTQQYRIVVRAEGTGARVTMLDKDANPVPADVARRVLGLLVNDLR